MDKLQSLRLLNSLYDMVKGIADENHFVRSNRLAEKLGLDESATLNLAEYLEGKKLVKVGSKLTGGDFIPISITEGGVNEVEAARENKETATEKYPPGMFSLMLNYGSVTGPVIQSSSNVQSTVNIGDIDVEKIKNFIALLRAEYQTYDLTPEKKSEIDADMNTIDAQVRSPNPKLGILHSIGCNIWDITKPFASEALKQVAMNHTIIIGLAMASLLLVRFGLNQAFADSRVSSNAPTGNPNKKSQARCLQ